jgi:CHASE3 domain sensor protein
MTFERIVNEVHEEIKRLRQCRTDDPARLKRKEEMSEASRERMRQMLERRWGKEK